MTVRILRTHELTIPIHIGERISMIIPGKINVTGKIRHLVEGTAWDQQILKGEKWLDLFCWSILGFSTLYLVMVCARMLTR
ncbi:MAG TPA: hypothetical protein DCG53_01485 [Syntrophus sp. (in: bacteria)]|jgi:hypothetical protein|nr:hypothetical protein [Syntrophus sp. (in: bacteria)]